MPAPPATSVRPGHPAFQRIAIVNRGEPAMRFLNTADDLRRQRGWSFRTIALHTDEDRHAWFVRQADEAFDLGPVTAPDPVTGAPRLAYLDLPRLEDALRRCGADAAWVGWGFVAEHPDFAESCRRLGITFIGPEPDTIRLLGDKVAAKQLAERADVPVAPWSGGPVSDVHDARGHAARIGYPVVLKAVAGGGGRGIRRVDEPGEMERMFPVARGEAATAFGDPAVFIEACVPAARHVEVQIAADHDGTVWALGVRDCTVQRRQQKLIEESSSPVLSRTMDDELRAAAVRLCRMANYCNVGTVEFLYDPTAERAWFMEVNTRLQVEHPVTEMTTGLDLVALQLDLAMGARLEGHPPPANGHAIEVRLNAEDPDRHFAPAPGPLIGFTPPQGPGIRVDAGVVAGDRISATFDSMIAKFIAWGHDRQQALARLTRALERSVTVVDGGATNRAFLLALVHHPGVLEATFNTASLDESSATHELVGTRHAALALIQAAVESAELDRVADQRHFFSTAARGRAELRDEHHAVELSYRGVVHRFHVFERGPEQYVVRVGGVALHVAVERVGDFERRMRVGERHYRLSSSVHGPSHLIEIGTESHRITRGDAGIVRASSPGVVVAVHVEPGQTVAAGAPLVSLEAMKVEMPIAAPFAGKVSDVLVNRNFQVDAGDPLIRLEIDADTGAGQATSSGGPLVDFDHLAPAGRPEPTVEGVFGAMRARLLGYECDPVTVSTLLDDHRALAATPSAALRQAEDRLLDLFSDVCELERDPTRELGDADTARNGREHLLTFLRSVERAAETVPDAFLDRLRRVLAHDGVTALERSPGLDAALVRVFRAQRDLVDSVPHATAVLRRRLDDDDRSGSPHTADDMARIDRLIAVSDGHFPVLTDHARAIRHRQVDRPTLDAVRAATRADVEHHLLLARSEASEVTPSRGVDALVDDPRRLLSALVAAMRQGPARVRRLALEVLVRRRYSVAGSATIDDRHPPVVTFEGDVDGRPVTVTGTALSIDELGTAIPRVMDAAVDTGASGDGRPAIVELVLLARPEESGGGEELTPMVGDALADALRRRPADADDERRVTQVNVTVDRGADRAPRQLLFRRDGDDLVEDPHHRDLHPALAERLELWRLSNFHLERLAAPEGVVLFRGTAHQNPSDDRLFALAEVHDLTRAGGDADQPDARPDLESTLTFAVSAIRQAQLDQPPRERPAFNRIVLVVRPTWDVTDEELRRIAHRLAPISRGLGIERVTLRVREPHASTGAPIDTVVHMREPTRVGVSVGRTAPSTEPIRSLTEYQQSVIRTKRRGEMPPYEIIDLMVAPSASESDFPIGEFTEYDLDDDGNLVEVDRPYGENTAHVVVGVITNITSNHPDGVSRVIILGDPGKSLGSLAEPECRRIIAALDRAEAQQTPVEWFTVSAGARVALDSGTENMDWTAAVLRRIVQFTQAGGELNIVAVGVNVGAQSYFDAEAAMLQHTSGVLIMTPRSSLVLTGKAALDASGGVSAESSLGIGGFERIMGPSGQAHYWAPDLHTACALLFRHYQHTYVAAGERFPRHMPTTDPTDRDITRSPHPRVPSTDFRTVGDIFSETLNPERKRPFDMRALMRAVTDRDDRPLERWRAWRGAETAIVWEARLGGIATTLVGIESTAVARGGVLPADGPESWTGGTLFPLSSKKVSRAINAASGRRPVTILANLSGFDGSPESMRQLQLEYGAEIGRAVVNFDGPIVFCVVSRYHGGAFVVFSKALNDQLEVAAVEGSRASVLGGVPAATVVFARRVDELVLTDPRLTGGRSGDARDVQVPNHPTAAGGADVSDLESMRRTVRTEKISEVAAEFDAVHTIERARQVGSVDEIIRPDRLRPSLIAALERGMRRARLGRFSRRTRDGWSSTGTRPRAGASS